MPTLPNYFVPLLAVIGVFLLSSAVFLMRIVQGRIKYWAPHVEKVRAGGYVPPQPYFLTALLMRSLCIVLGFLEVGPIKIVGRSRLPKSGPTIIAPFHVDAGDGSIISALLGIRSMYYLIRTTEVTGLRGWIGTLTGAIAVDEESQEGRSKAFKAAISALAGGGPNATMIIFPQGQLVPDEEVRRSDFKSGTMAIAKLAARKRKEPIWIVPIGMHYKTDPRDATLFQKTIQGLGFKKFRNLFGHQNYGAYAVVGKPFKVSPKSADLDEIAKGLTLEDDADKATDSYVQRLMILQKAAKKRAAARRRAKHEKTTT